MPVGKGRRLALIIGSQCHALEPLSMLPPSPSPVDPAALSGPERLLLELRDLLVDGPGDCDPVQGVEGLAVPGLLLNPTAAQARAALEAAMNAAHVNEAVLVVHVLAHGSGYQADPAGRVRHLLHAWDTVAAPIDTEPESRGWDPYDDIDRRRLHCAGMGGLVLVVDACGAGWAKEAIDAWSGVRGGLLSAVLAASGDGDAFDACLTRTVVDALHSGLTAAVHPRAMPLPELLTLDIEPVVARRCPHQTPRVAGHQSHNPVLHLGRNPAADAFARRLGLDGATATLVLRLTRHFVDHAVDVVVEALRSHRTVAIVGAAGTGKSALAAALRSPPDDSTVPFALVDAAAFASTTADAVGVARSLRAQLDAAHPHYGAAARRFERDNAYRWDTLDVWQRELIGPLRVLHHGVRLLVDGIDQLAEGEQVLRAAGPAARSLSSRVASGPRAGRTGPGRGRGGVGAGAHRGCRPSLSRSTRRQGGSSRPIGGPGGGSVAGAPPGRRA